MKKLLGALRRPVSPDLMQHSIGRGAQEDIIRAALARIDGAPAPDRGSMQAAMSNETQVRLAHDVIREHLDARGLSTTADWARARVAADTDGQPA
ncbi:hypothetical protein SRABI76_03303 [Microbacterium oxydans]|uniref:hypothetical protein n=1 Tax=Microbacterium oxydans TaxID=82380 RepID=UPI001DFA992F|nr:hypothetical protein [Microbacterium oxydans]CAH0253484.1 hypothetical protein SRABI76_03303 [Microbacterium oxydans]